MSNFEMDIFLFWATKLEVLSQKLNSHTRKFDVGRQKGSIGHFRFVTQPLDGFFNQIHGRNKKNITHCSNPEGRLRKTLQKKSEAAMKTPNRGC